MTENDGVIQLAVYKSIELGEGYLKVKRPITVKSADDFAKNFLVPITHSVQLWWGDFLNWAEEHLGEEYAQIVPEEIDTSSLLRWKWVCRKVPQSIRRRMKNLKYSHYEELAALEDEEEIEKMALKAENEAMSVRELRAIVKPRKGQAPVKKEVRCPKCGTSFEI